MESAGLHAHHPSYHDACLKLPEIAPSPSGDYSLDPKKKTKDVLDRISRPYIKSFKYLPNIPIKL